MHSQSIRTGETDRDHLINIIDEFSLDKDNPRLEQTINNVINSIDFNLNSIESSILLLDAFYKHFNLTDDSLEEKLIGPALYKDKEKLHRPKRLTDLISFYNSYKIGDLFKLSIVEFLQLNILEIKLLLESAEDLIESKSSVMSELLDDNKDLLGDLADG